MVVLLVLKAAGCTRRERPDPSEGARRRAAASPRSDGGVAGGASMFCARLAEQRPPGGPRAGTR